MEKGEDVLKLDGKVAIVTGAGREGKGIGRFVALALAREGADIVIADLFPEAAEGVADEVRSLGRQAISVRANVTDPGDAEAIVQQALDKFGKVDILVNNAGVTRDALIPRMSEEDWDLVIDTNLKGTFNCTKAVARPMLKQKSGRIVNVASVMGIIGNVGQANYSASKAGIIGLVINLAFELAPHNITVNGILPGPIKTPFWDPVLANIPEDERGAALDRIGQSVPLGRVGLPEDIANAVLFLCSDLSSWVTGQNINVGGGLPLNRYRGGGIMQPPPEGQPR